MEWTAKVISRPDRQFLLNLVISKGYKRDEFRVLGLQNETLSNLQFGESLSSFDGYDIYGGLQRKC